MASGNQTIAKILEECEKQTLDTLRRFPCLPDFFLEPSIIPRRPYHAVQNKSALFCPLVLSCYSGTSRMLVEILFHAFIDAIA